MLKKIKVFTGIVLVMFSVASLIVAVLKIWEVINGEMANEAFLKIAYTFGALFITSLVVFLVVNFMEEKK